ncbi:hypothetical protein PO124_30480 [Bacillus licheniformis]|nr:hypothetical protein [Bacillus licheniformis]
MKGRNKSFLSLFPICNNHHLAALVKPAINWKERLAVIGFMFVSISLFTFIIYVFINKPKKDQSAPRCNIVAKSLEETQKPFTLSFYFVGILIVGISVFSMSELSLAWKSGMFAILFAVISGNFLRFIKRRIKC